MKNFILFTLIASVPCAHAIDRVKTVDLGAIDPFTKRPLLENLPSSLAYAVDEDTGKTSRLLAARCYLALLEVPDARPAWCHAETVCGYLNGYYGERWRHPSGGTISAVHLYSCTPETASATLLETIKRREGVITLPPSPYWHTSLYEKFLAEHREKSLAHYVDLANAIAVGGVK